MRKSKKIKHLGFKDQVNNSRHSKSWTKGTSSCILQESVCGDKICYQKKPQAVFFDNLITIEELADYIGVSQKTIRNWISIRSIPFLRIGKKTFFRYEKLNSWFQTKEFEPCL